jgi:protocatechuate 3,4-dioxygenase beta subunit
VAGFGRGFQDAPVRSDADGLFEIDGLAPGSYRVSARHPDFAEGSDTVEVKDGAASVEIRLASGGTLAGLVVSEGRAPLPSAQVSLGTPGGGRGRGGQDNTTSDDSGRFRFDRLSPGRYSVSAALRAKSSPPAEVVLQAGESREDLVLAVGGGTTIHGRVSGLKGTAQSGVNVTASGPESFFSSARTAADGTFELSGAPAGAVDLHATAGDPTSGLRTASTQVEVAGDSTDVDAEIVFDAGFSLAGQVTRAGEPVADAMVSASIGGGGRPVAMARTDANGSYRLEGLAAASYSVTAAPPRGGARTETTAVADDATLDFVLPPARLSGVVVEAASRQPLADATVELEGDAAAAGPRGTPRAMTDSNGSFTIEDLEPRAYVATARKAGFEFDKETVTPADAGEPVVFTLRRGEGLSVRAHDGVFGVPLRSLVARATDPSNTPVFAGQVPLDSSGEGEIPSLKPGTYTLRLAAAGYAPLALDVAVPSAPLDLALTPGGSLEIHAGPETLGRPGASARILTAAGAPYSPSVFSPDGRIPLSAPVRRVENVAPGRYTLVVEGGASRDFAVVEGGKVVVEVP